MMFMNMPGNWKQMAITINAKKEYYKAKDLDAIRFQGF